MEGSEQGQRVMENKIEKLGRGFGKDCGIKFRRNRKTFNQEMDMIWWMFSKDYSHYLEMKEARLEAKKLVVMKSSM